MTTIITLLLSIIGSWGIFVKCGKKGWYSLIPFVSEYQLGLCADREKDGIAYMVFGTLFTVTSSIYSLFEENSKWYIVLLLVTLILSIPYIVFTIRVYIGLCERFRRKKLWLILWIIFEPLAIFIWGVFKQFQPKPLDVKQAVISLTEPLQALSAKECCSGLYI